MKRYFVAARFAAVTALVLTSGGARLLAADDLPKADAILDKFVEATGGKAAYEKVHTQVASGSMDINGMKGTMTLYKAEPNKVYTEIELQGIGEMQDGFNGAVAWSNSAMQGPHIKEGDEKSQAQLMAHFNSELNWRDDYSKVETAGAETVEGKDCYKVVLTPKAGKPITHYYDKTTGLLVKTVMSAASPMGEVDVASVMDDYHKDGDILSPHKLTNSVGPMQFSVTIDKVQYNTEIPASRFDLPDEIKALVNKK